MVLRGLYTAVVTPFNADGTPDIERFLKHLDMQADHGVDGVVVCGSTGEGATLSADEKTQLWAVAVEHLDGRLPVIAGTGTNDTRTTIDLTRRAAGVGAAAALVVTPYYNKPTVAGQLAHHCAIADATDLPQILYNVPSRTGTNMTAETQLAIADSCPTVIGTKEASANMDQIGELIRQAPGHFAVIAGDDSLALAAIACGGVGCIAVISNYAPQTFSALVHATLAGDLDTARQLQRRLMPYYSANFLESNPGPVKTIMELLGHGPARYRLPLVAPTAATRQRLADLFEGFVDA